MAMNPRTHPVGAPPRFDMTGLPPNPNPRRITEQLWWLVCMRDLLEPRSQNGGVFADKPGYHNAGENLRDDGLGRATTDHSIRRAPDRSGPWWREYASAHDWTFDRAHTGNYTEINLYMERRINAMRSPTDLRPDDVYAYTIGNLDGDATVEGYNEYKDAPETGDKTHLWHIHDSFRRNIIGDKWAMWKALTIDMGWTYAEWQRSVRPAPAPNPVEVDMAVELNTPIWDKDNPPAWTAIYQGFLAGANPTFVNLVLHGLRHAAETGNAVDQLLVSQEAILAGVNAILADPSAMSAPEDHPVVRAVRWAMDHPPTGTDS